jgi:hypothetical protein
VPTWLLVILVFVIAGGVTVAAELPFWWTPILLVMFGYVAIISRARRLR